MDAENPLICTSDLEDPLDLKQCAFSSLAYSQWLNGTVLETISGAMSDEVTSYGYVINYADYVDGWITPEYGFWKASNDVQGLSTADFPTAMLYTYGAMDAWFFFNRVELAHFILEPD